MSGIASRQHAAVLQAIAASEARIMRRLDAIEGAVDRRGPRDRITAHLVSAIARACGSRVFTAAELIAHGRADADLLDALGAALIDSPKQCGKLLRRLEGREIGGLVVERVGAGRDGVIWRVRVSRV